MKRTIENPIIGDRVTFLKTSKETNGEYVHVEVELKPGGGNDLHYHTCFEERFEVVDGHLNVKCNGTEYLLGPGDKITAPAHSIHRFYNKSAKDVRFKAVVEPAFKFEEGIRIAYGLAADGRCSKKGMPRSFWHLAILIDMGETYFPGIPYRAQRILYKSLGRVARLLGKDKELQRYLE
ncbi:cupin domain-containing protein [Dyadobacter sp. LJ53]|uniref:cupin domain-containing protein n=1 Tax=Dyadobacter chenwenxiniae TaxID=2906456 RepID=UPI001F1D28FA|nr:cupin domain-containing protein [Dyadobacter chenwenxiniae]MCF0051666.1 cupin domain-containing protein [Dyadobacter chenwenxiniae]